MTTTDRFALPLLVAGQSQKEVTHNEALALIDILVQPIVEAVAPANIPSSPVVGQSWIVGNLATGDWSGHDGALACWTSGGWRFASLPDGASVWSRTDSMSARRQNGAWVVGVENVKHLTIDNIQVVGGQQAAIATPANGNTVDTEGRSAISAILGALRAHGLIAT